MIRVKYSSPPRTWTPPPVYCLCVPCDNNIQLPASVYLPPNMQSVWHGWTFSTDMRHEGIHCSSSITPTVDIVQLNKCLYFIHSRYLHSRYLSKYPPMPSLRHPWLSLGIKWSPATSVNTVWGNMMVTGAAIEKVQWWSSAGERQVFPHSVLQMFRVQQLSSFR